MDLFPNKGNKSVNFIYGFKILWAELCLLQRTEFTIMKRRIVKISVFI